jgi:hypothetical protein
MAPYSHVRVLTSVSDEPAVIIFTSEETVSEPRRMQIKLS